MHKDFTTKTDLIAWLNRNRSLTILDIEVVGKVLRVHFVQEQ